MSKPFQLLLRVRYGECDAQQVVFNARYADYADIASTELMRATIGGYQTLIGDNLDTQVVNLNINWNRSARFDDVLRLVPQITKVGNTSFTMTVGMYLHHNNDLVATAELTYVLVSTIDFTKTAISESLKKRFLKGAPDKIVDMVGDI